MENRQKSMPDVAPKMIVAVPSPVTLNTLERDILDRQRDGLPPTEEENRGGVAQLSTYATATDRALLIAGSICCVAAGALNPLLTVIYGQFVGSFDKFTKGEIDSAQLREQVATFSLSFVYLAIGIFCCIYVATFSVFLVGDRVTSRLRRDYLKSVLRQNMAFFDILGVGRITSSLISDVHLVQEAISGKISLTLTAAATCITALVITFVECWKLALCLLSTVAVMTAVNTIGTRLAIRYNKKALRAFSDASELAEESLISHRYVAAFGILDTLAERYESHLARARSLSLRARGAVAIMTAAFMGTMYMSSGLSFWEGSRLLVGGEASASSIVTCSMAIIISALTIGKVAPNAQAFFTGIAGAGRLFEHIRRSSPLDPFSKAGVRAPLARLAGKIEFKSVKLVYPFRPDTVALDGLSISFPAGKTTAIIGASGSGKSSIFWLLERFYEPLSGSITIDDVDIRDMNLGWLRQQMSIVNQEPVLFNTSIFENILYGLISDLDGAIPAGSASTRPPSSEDGEIRELVYQAAKTANAHDFITALPEGYNTQVGQMGSDLSGGQRQRIAIARAIIRNPRILLLDEATASLDSRSELLVLDALNRVSSGRTTIVVTHRLSSLRHAEQIVVLSPGGRVVEAGDHDSLVRKPGGVYAAALEKQNLSLSSSFSGRETKYYGVEEGQAAGSGRDDHGASVSVTVTTPVAGQAEEPLGMNRLEKGSEVDRGGDGGAINLNPRQVEMTGKDHRDKPNDHGREHDFSLWSLVRLAFNLNRPELPIIIAGLACCLISGSVNPIQSLLFAHNIDALSLPPLEYGDLRSQVDFWSLMYLVLGLGALLAWTGQGVSLAYCSEAITYRARSKAFRFILAQDDAFFDRPDRTTGSLMKILSASVTEISGLGGAVLSTILTALATLVGGLALSLVIGWKLALVCAATIPVVLACGWLRLRVLSAMEAKVRQAYVDSAAYASEALMGIRTVAALSMEERVLDTYQGIVEQTTATNLRSILWASGLYAASQSVVFLVSALGFWYGGGLIAEGSYTMFQYFVCFAALVSGSQSVGAVFSFAPDMSKAMHGGRDLRRLFDENLDTSSKSDVIHPGGEDAQEKVHVIIPTHGTIQLHNVSFRYPNRPAHSLALNGINLTIHPKQSVALVGASGCGKSTVVSLLERFIDPTDGSVTLNGVDLRELDLGKYRDLISYVGQEPFIYQTSIKENLTLGVGRAAHLVSEEDILRACREANIDGLVRSLPDGIETQVGSRGVMLSGGQRQRIAVARALLRNSPILLLDEATSALDGESEGAVQEALDAVSRDRTTIVVAHRLHTIRRADLICVMSDGAIVERGTHEQLLTLGGKYADMVRLQSLERNGRSLPKLDE